MIRNRAAAILMALSGLLAPALPTQAPKLPQLAVYDLKDKKRKGRGLSARNVFATGRTYFKPNGERECKRRRRQIGQGILTRANGLAV